MPDLDRPQGQRDEKEAAQSETQQQEGTEPTRELSKNERGRVQPTPERTSDRDLGAPLPATVPTIPYYGTDTGGEIQGEEHWENTPDVISLYRIQELWHGNQVQAGAPKQ